MQLVNHCSMRRAQQKPPAQIWLLCRWLASVCITYISQDTMLSWDAKDLDIGTKMIVALSAKQETLAG